MKKVFCVLVCVLLVCGLTACNKQTVTVLSDVEDGGARGGEQADTATTSIDAEDGFAEDEGDGEEVDDGTGRTKKTRKTTTARTKKTTAGTNGGSNRTTTKRTTAKRTEDPATYYTYTKSVSELVNGGKWLAHGRAALVGEEFQMDWVNTGFEVTGKLGGTLSIETVSTRSDSLLNVIIDDEEPIIVHVPNGTATVTLVTGLMKGPHTVKVISGTSVRFGTLSVKKFTYDGELSAVSRPASRMRIEVIGDSISCGWGMDGSSGAAYSEQEQVEISNSYYSYAAIAARYLNADLQVVAQCAQTIPGMHAYFPKLNKRTATWDFKKNQQDVVIINLGTNDEWQGSGLGKEQYNAANSLANMKALLKDVRKAYPDAYVIWVYGMMRKTYESEYKEAVSSMNDAKMFTLDMTAYKSSGGYDGNHPKRDSHEEVGAVLADFIELNCK